MYQIFTIIGIIGSIICAIRDFFLYRCQGTDSVRIGNYKKIESNWDKAKTGDFIVSGVLASVSIPLYYLGWWLLHNRYPCRIRGWVLHILLF